ncbi:helix-turn-helix transcriptional regulator [Paenibacillus brevis]|uniref:Helix-turn-helix domain-containing protein n=1 Tax=Paenibacillus brevis TaxID=2841508 RepID=A0ABS6FJU9_9BACL|nr:helix-turn-helix transcriptional regulator [Paenibacillus brevis]MBU5670279.1 helix-turn-helix domain-containing protein [Paenibacillus brevis]
MKNHTLIKSRKKKGFTQEELAKKLGYSKGTVSNWENGYSNPSLPDAFKISEILDEDINILFLVLKVHDWCTKEQSATSEHKEVG